MASHSTNFPVCIGEQNPLLLSPSPIDSFDNLFGALLKDFEALIGIFSGEELTPESLTNALKIAVEIVNSRLFTILDVRCNVRKFTVIYNGYYNLLPTVMIMIDEKGIKLLNFTQEFHKFDTICSNVYSALKAFMVDFCGFVYKEENYIALMNVSHGIIDNLGMQ
jgi:hypothetical protein